MALSAILLRQEKDNGKLKLFVEKIRRYDIIFMMNSKFQKIVKMAKPFFKPYHVQYLGVFGSYARGSAKNSSDIDLLVKFKSPPGLIDYIRLEEDLGRVLGRKVDLVSMGGISPQLEPYIKQDLITLYENR